MCWSGGSRAAPRRGANSAPRRKRADPNARYVDDVTLTVFESLLKRSRIQTDRAGVSDIQCATPSAENSRLSHSRS